MSPGFHAVRRFDRRATIAVTVTALLATVMVPSNSFAAPSDFTVELLHSGVSIVGEPVLLDGALLFSGRDQAGDVELWRTDGTAQGTVRVLDIDPSVSSGPNYLTLLGTHLYFTAVGGIWRSDGTAAGTTQVVPPMAVNGMARQADGIVFGGDDGSGHRLWRLHADGVLARIEQDVIVTCDRDPHVVDTAVSPVQFTTISGGLVLFRASSKRCYIPSEFPDADFLLDSSVGALWVTDGTDAGTHVVELPDHPITVSGDITAPGVVTAPRFIIGTGDGDGFGQGHIPQLGFEPWVFDSATRTVAAWDVRPGVDGSAPARPHAAGGAVWFSADDGATGRELYRLPLGGAPSLVSDLNPTGNGLAGSEGPFYGTWFDNRLFFAGDDGSTGLELYATDGTASGTQLVKDIWTGTGAFGPGVPNPGEPTGWPGNFEHEASGFMELANHLVFGANDGTGREPFATDGTTGGTGKIADLNPTVSFAGADPGQFSWLNASTGVFNADTDGDSVPELHVIRTSVAEALPNLTIEKHLRDPDTGSIDPATVRLGDEYEFIMTVTNETAVVYPGSMVVEDWAIGTTIDPSDPNFEFRWEYVPTSTHGDDWTCALVGPDDAAGVDRLRCNHPGPLNGLSSTSFVVRVEVVRPGDFAPPELSNTASVSGSAAELDLSDNDSNTVLASVTFADPALTFTAPSIQVTEGAVFQTQLVLGNGGLLSLQEQLQLLLEAGTGVSITGVSADGFTCTVGGCTGSPTLATGEEVTFDITGTADSTASPMSSLSATLTYGSGDVADGDITNNSATQLVDVTATSAQPDLTVTKTPLGPANLNDLQTYELVVSNAAGAADVVAEAAITVEDIPGTGVILDGTHGTRMQQNIGDGWVCDITVRKCTHPGPLAAGASLPALPVVVYLDRSAFPATTNEAEVTLFGQTDGNVSNNSSIVEIVPSPPNLVINKELIGEAIWNELSTFRITVSNLGPGTAVARTTVTEVLGPGLAVEAALPGTGVSGDGWSCATTSPQTSLEPLGDSPTNSETYLGTDPFDCWHDGTIGPGTSLPVLEVKALVTDAARLGSTNSAFVAGDDPQGQQFVEEDTLTVAARVPDLVVSHLVPTEPVTLGQTERIIFLVQNQGTAPWVGPVTLDVNLNSSSVSDVFDLVSLSGTGWDCDETILTCVHPGFGAGLSLPEVEAVVVPRAGSADIELPEVMPIRGEVQSEPLLSDPFPTNDVTEGAPPVLSPDLFLQKRLVAGAEAGGIATFSLHVHNIGDGDTSQPIVLTEQPGAGLSVVSMSGTGWACPTGGSVCTHPGPLAAGASLPDVLVQMQVATDVPAATMNEAQVSHGQPDVFVRYERSTVDNSTRFDFEPGLEEDPPPPTCDGVPATIVGTEGPDVLTGTADRDVIVGLGGDDVIDGLAGDDLICAGPGADVAEGGSGDDTILGGEGNDTLRGGPDDDTISGEHGDDPVLNGGTGDDTVIGGGGDDVLFGEGGQDELHGGDGADKAFGGHGNDLLTGGEGTDTLAGTDGADTLHGGPDADLVDGGEGADVLHGDGGHDLVRGGGGNDTLFGGDGNDRIFGDAIFAFGTPGDDLIHGGEGDDRIYAVDESDTIHGGPGNDRIDCGAGNDPDDVCTVYGGDGDDRIEGSFRADRLFGEAGNDRITGDYGEDWIEGGTGDDWLHGGGHADHIEGGDGDDYLDGDALPDHLDGGEGHDWIDGGGHHDDIFGGPGDDTINGQDGNDTILAGDGDDFLDGGDDFDHGAGGDGHDVCINFQGERGTPGCEEIFTPRAYWSTRPRHWLRPTASLR